MSVMAPEDEELTVAPQTDRAPMVAVALIVLGLGAWIISIFTINIKHVNGLGFLPLESCCWRSLGLSEVPVERLRPLESMLFSFGSL